MAATKVITGKVRFSYVNIFKARGFNGGDEKYSICLLIPKEDQAPRDKIEQAGQVAVIEGMSS